MRIAAMEGSVGAACCSRIASNPSQLKTQYYLEQLIRYIHLNPVRAGVCSAMRQLDRYPWTGHRGIVGNDSRGFQELKQVLRRFGKTAEVTREKYR